MKLFCLIISLSLTWTASAQVSSQPREKVSLERAKTDPVYRQVLNHHVCIKSFLNAPAQKRPEFRELLLFLLQNGYSIDDLRKAWFAVNWPSRPPLDVDKLRARGASDAAIERRRILRASVDPRKREQFVVAMTGVEDKGILETMLAIVPEQETFSEDMPLLKAVEGEPLLGDSAWLVGPYRDAVAAYTGQPKRMFPKAVPQDPVRQPGDQHLDPIRVPIASPSGINENENPH